MKDKKENSRNAAGSADRDELNRKAKLLGIKYIDLKFDFAFKTVFGTPGNEDLLLMLLDSILPEKHIQSVELGPQELQGDGYESKRVIYASPALVARKSVITTSPVPARFMSRLGCWAPPNVVSVFWRVSLKANW